MSVSGMYNCLRKELPFFNWKILNQDKVHFPTEIEACGYIGSRLEFLDAVVAVSLSPKMASFTIVFDSLAKTVTNFELINKFNLSRINQNFSLGHQTSCIAGIDDDGEFVINIGLRKFSSPRQLTDFLTLFLDYLNRQAQNEPLSTIIERTNG